MAIDFRVRFIDVAKGIALLFMMWFHLMYDLALCRGFDFNVKAWGWKMLSFPVWGVFIGSAGLLQELSYEKNRENFWERSIRRLLRLAFCAVCISFITWFYWNDQWIAFGILHFFVVAGSIGIVLAGRTMLILIISLIVLVSSKVLLTLSVDTNMGMIFGITSPSFSSLDYFPLFPWFGIYGSGMVVGRLFLRYPRQIKEFDILVSKKAFSGFFRYLGQHSLFLYLVHQPVFLALIYLLSACSSAG